MKVLFVLLSLILATAQLPFGPSTPEKPEEEPSPVKGWRIVKYFAVPPTQYSTAGKGIIKAESVGSRASLYKSVGEKLRTHSVLSWKWKISNVVRSAIETRTDRFDAAARVMVVLGPGEGFSPFGRGEPQGLKIEYIWASHLPRNHHFDHPGERDCKVFVLEAGDGKAGQWIHETRNLKKDFQTAFGREYPGVFAIGIQTDTDQSNEMVTAYYSEPVLHKK